MKINFYVSEADDGSPKQRVFTLYDAVKGGASLFGDIVEYRSKDGDPTADSECDIACIWGVVNTRKIVDNYRAIGKRVLQFDKPYIRKMPNRSGHIRVGIDGPSPEKYINRVFRHFDRWEEHGVTLQELTKNETGPIVYAGSSQKYCDFYELGNANDYAEVIINEIRNRVRKRRIIYRPKPSWKDFRTIDGTDISRPPEELSELLNAASLLVTHGSAAAVEAIVYGVPAICFGPCAAGPVAGSSFDDVRSPVWLSRDARYHWACNLAYCQWTPEEFQSGEAWDFYRKELEATK